jgi:hypothetical protein
MGNVFFALVISSTIFLVFGIGSEFESATGTLSDFKLFAGNKKVGAAYKGVKLFATTNRALLNFKNCHFENFAAR